MRVAKRPGIKSVPIERAFERFYARVEPEPNTGCWLWAGVENGSGYGQFWFNNRMVYAHRWIFEAHRGAIPKGLELDHLCRVRCCVNPFHLEPVTQQENIRRGEAGAHLRREARERRMGIKL